MCVCVCVYVCLCACVCMCLCVYGRERVCVCLFCTSCAMLRTVFFMLHQFFRQKSNQLRLLYQARQQSIPKTAEKEIHLFYPPSVLYVFGCLTKSNKGSKIKMLIRYCLFVVLTPMVFTCVKESRVLKSQKKRHQRTELYFYNLKSLLTFLWKG